MKTSHRRARALAAIACGLETAAAVYALVRIVQFVFIPEPNPAIVIASVHAGYFWRAWIAAYAGGFAALTTALVVRKTEPLARLALAALPWTALFAVLQALFVP